MTARPAATGLALALLALPVGPSPAAASPGDEALEAFRKAERTLAVTKAAWWKGFDDAERRAVEAWRRPDREQFTDGVLEPAPDEPPIDELFGRWAEMEATHGRLFRDLGASGSPKALPLLWKEAMAAVAEAEAAEAANAPGEVKRWKAGPSQEPSIRIHGLARRREGLVEGLAAAPGAAEFLAGDGLQEAARADARARAVARRVLVADALARVPSGRGREALAALLKDPAPALRIAALEGLQRAGGLDAASGTPLLADPELAVRFALADVLLAAPPREGAWVGPLLEAYGAASGRWRREALAVLRRVTGRADGDDPAAWSAWFASASASLGDGSYRWPAADAAPPPLPPDPAAAYAYGIPLPTHGLLLAADGWDDLVVPAKYEFQRTRHFRDWTTGSRDWRKERESVGDVFFREVRRALASLAEPVRFRILLSGHAANQADAVSWYPEKGPVAVSDPQRRRAAAFLEDFKVGMTENFQHSLRLLQDETWADTAVLVTNGNRKLGRFMCGQALLEEFVRRHRFRRLRLHVVHFMDHGAETTRVLRGLAESTGGTYIRALESTPP